MLADGLIQISATVVSAVSLAAIAFGLCAVKQESRLFNGCVKAFVARAASRPKPFAIAMEVEIQQQRSLGAVANTPQ